MPEPWRRTGRKAGHDHFIGLEVGSVIESAAYHEDGGRMGHFVCQILRQDPLKTDRAPTQTWVGVMLAIEDPYYLWWFETNVGKLADKAEGFFHFCEEPVRDSGFQGGYMNLIHIDVFRILQPDEVAKVRWFNASQKAEVPGRLSWPTAEEPAAGPAPSGAAVQPGAAGVTGLRAALEGAAAPLGDEPDPSAVEPHPKRRRSADEKKVGKEAEVASDEEDSEDFAGVIQKRKPLKQSESALKLRRTKKKKKKNKKKKKKEKKKRKDGKDDAEGSTSDDSTDSSSDESVFRVAPLPEGIDRLKRTHLKKPGRLANLTLQRYQELLQRSTGRGADEEGTEVMPAVGRAYLQQVYFVKHPVNTLGIRTAQEMRTVMLVVDYLARNMVPAALDVLLQRQKALELSVEQNSSSWWTWKKPGREQSPGQGRKGDRRSSLERGRQEGRKEGEERSRSRKVVSSEEDLNFQRWSDDPLVSELLANMLWCLPDDERQEASKTWADMLSKFDAGSKVTLLLERLMRTIPELGLETKPRGGSDGHEVPEPSDAPGRGVELTTKRGIKICLATEGWIKNPSDGGVYVGNGRPGWPRSNFWADSKLKLARAVGRRILCGRCLYVGHEDEVWNAEELIEMWNLDDCSGVEPPRSQNEGLRELRLLAEGGLSACCLGLVLKYVILNRPSRLGGFARGLPAAALETLQAERSPLLPMCLPVESTMETEVTERLNQVRHGERLPPEVALELSHKIPAVGQLCWEWLLILMMNWGVKGHRTEEVWIPYHSTRWSPEQRAVAQRVQSCVAHFCEGDRRVEMKPWKERSLRRGPGHVGLPLQSVLPVEWDAIKDSFDSHPFSIKGSVVPARTERLQEPVRWTRTEVELVHRTGKVDHEENLAPEVLVDSEAEWEKVIGGLFKLGLVEAEEAPAGVGSKQPALVGMFGIHRCWNRQDHAEPRRLQSLVFDVDLVNLLFKEQEGQPEKMTESA
eukprot:Skav215958  [mRNA]  locus=scaffold226:1048162:1051189:+ [translate_table: standard]